MCAMKLFFKTTWLHERVCLSVRACSVVCARADTALTYAYVTHKAYFASQLYQRRIKRSCLTTHV